MPDDRFEQTVRNLLKMKPKPHDEEKGKEKEGRDKPARSPADKKTTSS